MQLYTIYPFLINFYNVVLNVENLHYLAKYLEKAFIFEIQLGVTLKFYT